MSPPLERHRDRFFIPSDPLAETTPTKQTITRRDSAIRAINNWFKTSNEARILEMMTIDAIVVRCFSLRAVVSYINCDPSTDRYTHHNNIKTHISMKLKEYIDGKF